MLNHLGPFGTTLEHFGPYGTILNTLRPLWTIYEYKIFDSLETHWDYLGKFWIVLDHLDYLGPLGTIWTPFFLFFFTI